MNHWTDFFPYVAMAIKVIALGVAGYFAIKWHFDQDRKLKNKEKEEQQIKTQDQRTLKRKYCQAPFYFIHLQIAVFVFFSLVILRES